MMRVSRCVVPRTTTTLLFGATALQPRATNAASIWNQARALSGGIIPPPPTPPVPPPPQHQHPSSTSQIPTYPLTAAQPTIPINLLSRRPFTDISVAQRLDASRKYNQFKSPMWVGVRELTELLEDVQNICADASDSSSITPKKNYHQAALCKTISGNSTRLVHPDTVRILVSYLLTHGIPDALTTVVGSGGGLEFINLDQLESMGRRFNTDNPPSCSDGDELTIAPLAVIESACSVFTGPAPPSSPPNTPPSTATSHHRHHQQPVLTEESISGAPLSIQCLSSMGNPFNPTTPFHIELCRNIQERQLPCMGVYLQLQSGKESTNSAPPFSLNALGVAARHELEMNRHYWLSANDAHTFGTTIIPDAQGVRKYTNNVRSTFSDSRPSAGFEYFHFTDLADPTVCGIQTCLSLKEARQVCMAPNVSSEVSEDRQLQLLSYLRSHSVPTDVPVTKTLALTPPLTSSKKPRRAAAVVVDPSTSSSFRPQPVSCREAPILRQLGYHSRMRLQGHYVRVLRHRHSATPLSPLWGTHEALEAAASHIVSVHTQLFGSTSERSPPSPRIQESEIPVAIFQGQRLVLFYNACQLEGTSEFHAMLDRVSNAIGIETTTTPVPPPTAHL